MAQTKDTSGKAKSSAGNKTGAKSSGQSKRGPKTQVPEEEVIPIRRELCGVAFCLLALFTIIGYIKPEGSFILFFSDLIKGLIGWGYWLTAPIFILCGIRLIFHHGRPVVFRCFCALLLPLLLASVLNVFLYEAVYKLPQFDIKAIAGELFVSGQELKSAGALGGLLAVGLERALGEIGTVIVLVFLLAGCAAVTFAKGLKKAAQQFQQRAASPIVPELDMDLPPEKGSKAKQENTEKKKIQRVERSSYMDIPLGEDEEPLFEKRPSRAKPRPQAKRAGEQLDEPPAREPYRHMEEDLFMDPVQPGKAQRSGGRRKTPIVHEAAPQREPLGQKQAMPGKDFDGLTKQETDSIADVIAQVQREERHEHSGPAFTSEINDPPKGRKAVADALGAVSKAIKAGAGGYQYPPLELLHGSSGTVVDSGDEVEVNQRRLEGAIHSFGIAASVVGSTRGPTVTRYDVALEQGVKLSRLTNLAGDLALALGVINVRIAPIPDKISTVGIEVPNKIVSTVYLRDIIGSAQFRSAKSKLSFALGKDISGSSVVGNIAKLPHLLIAGTTGSGKSVCMNSLILSLLYKAKPEEVRLIMIDPKMVELGVYNGIPHMYVPVVTDPKKAAGALQWAVVEMLKRYRCFSEIGVRDLANYNKFCTSNGRDTLPQVVIVIDELADLMLVASKEVEESICRVAQMGRAAGMHLVIATQRPSADVITGLMKANIPSRIAFAVSSSMESRIILDQSGAEQLVGMGDMLFSPVGCGKPMRIQGAFVSDEDREEVIQFIKETAGEAKHDPEIQQFMDQAAQDKGGKDGGRESHDDAAGGYDEMLPQAVEVALSAGSVSVSMLQRRVKLGYARAARIMDQMEELGVVGPYEGAKPRQVVMDRESWLELAANMGLDVADSPI